MRIIAITIAWMGWMSLAMAAPTVAVLEVNGPADGPPARTMAWTDHVRRAVRRAAPSDWVIPDRGTIEAFLPPGTTLSDCEGECEVTTGRRLGAEYVVTARVTTDAARWRVTIAAHATASGRVVGQAQRETDAAGVLSALTEAATAVMAQTRPKPTAGGAAVTVVQAEPFGWYGGRVLRIEASQRLTIYAMGRKQGVTPLRITLNDQTRLRLQAEAAGHRTKVFEVELPPRSGQVTLTLDRKDTELRVTTPFEDDTLQVGIEIDGEPTLLDPRHFVTPGPHRIRLTHPCMTPVEFEIDGKAGEVIKKTIEPTLTCGRFRIEGPKGATIAWKGVRRLPFESEMMAPQSLPLTVRATGHRSKALVVEVPGPGTHVYRVDLEPVWADVEIETLSWKGEPCAGEVLIDGEPMGKTPWRGRVISGPRRIEARCGTDRRRRMREDAILSLGKNTIVLRQPGDTAEIMVRTDTTRHGFLLYRKWTDVRGAGRPRFSGAFAFGIANTDEKALPAFGFDLGLAMGVTDWMELGLGTTIGIGPEDCRAAEGDPGSDDDGQEECGFGYFSGRVETRFHTGRFVSVLGWGVSATSSRFDGGAKTGLTLGVGGSF